MCRGEGDGPMHANADPARAWWWTRLAHPHSHPPPSYCTPPARPTPHTTHRFAHFSAATTPLAHNPLTPRSLRTLPPRQATYIISSPQYEESAWTLAVITFPYPARLELIFLLLPEALGAYFLIPLSLKNIRFTHAGSLWRITFYVPLAKKYSF